LFNFGSYHLSVSNAINVNRGSTTVATQTRSTATL